MFDLDNFKHSDEITKETSDKKRTKSAWVRPLAVLALLFLLALVVASTGTQDVSAVGPPTVNGLFYGDGDDAIYWPYGFSQNGSLLYVYYDSVTLYGALVVNRAINDNVCAAQGDATNTTYAQNAGYANHRSCKRLTDSEFASFVLTCNTNPSIYNWYQGYAMYDAISDDWISDLLAAPPMPQTPPPGLVMATSMAWNINYYQDNWVPPPYPDPTGPPWDLYDGNGAASPIDDWHSPFDHANRTQIIGLDGYPTINTSVFSSFYQWEWPMVYEWSIDIATACEANPGESPDPVFVVAGESHHSPPKEGGPTDDEFDPFYDLGDLPDSYSTLFASGGPRHEFVISDNVFLGPTRDNEADGNPSFNATGDDVDKSDDEDGVTLGGQQWINDAVVNINISIQGIAPSADVGMWLDWNNNGSFDCSEFYAFTDLTVGANNVVQVTVPGVGAYNVGDPIAMRVRVFDDETNAPGGSLDCTDFGGAVDNGEIEDYIWPFTPTAITLTDVSANPASGFYPLLWLGLIILAALTAIVLIRRSQQEAA